MDEQSTHTIGITQHCVDCVDTVHHWILLHLVHRPAGLSNDCEVCLTDGSAGFAGIAARIGMDHPGSACVSTIDFLHHLLCIRVAQDHLIPHLTFITRTLSYNRG